MVVSRNLLNNEYCSSAAVKGQYLQGNLTEGFLSASVFEVWLLPHSFLKLSDTDL
jgi:hypothetical protein